MKLDVYNFEGKKESTIELPQEFEKELRPDLIKRAVLYLQSLFRQPYGAKEKAGMRHSADLSRRRRKYRGSYGKGISRVPRKILSRRGLNFVWVGAVAPGTVGGRRAHPPKAEKVWAKKINKKERRQAILSALNAALNKDLVVERGHKVPENYPFAIINDFEKVSKTKDAVKILESLGFKEELERAKVKKVRAGKLKNRGRPYKKKKSLLIVVSENCAVKDALSNVPGVDVVRVDELNALLLAPGTHYGRATLFTDKALELLKEKKLFLN